MPAFEAYSGIKNVKDYGAVGNGSTDDHAAIQAAVDKATGIFSSTDRGVIAFPRAHYRITEPVVVDTAIRRIIFDFRGSRLSGDFAGALISRPVESPFGGIYVIKDGQLYNDNSAGIGVLWHSTIGGGIFNCEINAWRGVETYNSQATTIKGCSIIRGVGTKSTSIGILAGNATAVINTDVSSYGEGIRHQNAGLQVVGGRYEVNTIGMRIGVDQNGDTFQSSGFKLFPGSCEQNDTGIQIVAGAGGKIGASSFGSGVEVVCALDIQSIQDSLVAGLVASSGGGFSDVAIRVDAATRLAMMGVSGPSWAVDGGVDTSAWLATNYSP